MSGTTIKDELNYNDENISTPGADPGPEVGNIAINESPSFNILEFLKTPTGEGEIEDYLSHPLNFNSSKAVAQIIRGVTGLLGNLKFAILDILFGILRFSKERSSTNAN